MSELKGVIVDKGERKGTKKNGDEWTRYSFTIRDSEGKDHKCSTFNQMFDENIHRDDLVILEIEGQYNNLVEIKECAYDETAANEAKSKGPTQEGPSQTTIPSGGTSVPAPQKPEPDWDAIRERKKKEEDRRQHLIVRQNCLTNANKLIENMGALGFSEEDRKKLLLTGDPVEVVKNFAKKFEEFVFREP